MATKKNRHSETGKAIAKAILEQYKPTNREEMQDALKADTMPGMSGSFR